MPPDSDQHHHPNANRRRSRGLNDSLNTHRNLYEVLGLNKSATDEDIKRAYRRMALRWHPDKNRNDPNASIMFQEINYANAVLSNVTKRRVYDQYGEVGLKMMQQVGEDNMNFVLRPWVKWLFCFLGIITCGFFCCFCCCCCCFKCCFNFCCGMCKPTATGSSDNPFEAFNDTQSDDVENPIRAQPASTVNSSSGGGAGMQQFTSTASASVHIDMPPPDQCGGARNEPPPPYAAPPPYYSADSPIAAPAPSYGSTNSAKE